MIMDWLLTLFMDIVRLQYVNLKYVKADDWR